MKVLLFLSLFTTFSAFAEEIRVMNVIGHYISERSLEKLFVVNQNETKARLEIKQPTALGETISDYDVWSLDLGYNKETGGITIEKNGEVIECATLVYKNSRKKNKVVRETGLCSFRTERSKIEQHDFEETFEERFYLYLVF